MTLEEWADMACRKFKGSIVRYSPDSDGKVGGSRKRRKGYVEEASYDGYTGADNFPLPVIKLRVRRQCLQVIEEINTCDNRVKIIG